MRHNPEGSSRPQECTLVNLIKFNKDKCKVLHLGHGELQVSVQTGACIDWKQPCWQELESAAGWKTEYEPAMSLQLSKPILSWAVWKGVWPQGQRKWFFLSVPLPPHLKYCVVFWGPQQKDMGMLEQVQGRAAMTDRGIEHLSYEKKAKKVWVLQPGEEKGLFYCRLTIIKVVL